MIKKFIFSLIPREYIWALVDFIKPKTFGQLGEDSVIENHLIWLGLDINKKGSYVDIGAYHPTRYSNTYKFYKKGSSGYVIDIGLRKKKIWKILRPRDIFINTAVVQNSYKQKTINFVMKDDYGNVTDHLENSGVIKDFSKNEANIHKVKATTADEICKKIIEDKNWTQATWKFLNIDIEGMDEIFIKDLNLTELSPDIIAIEFFLPKEISFVDKVSYISSCNLIKDLSEKGFVLQSICGPTLIFVRIQSYKRNR